MISMHLTLALEGLHGRAQGSRSEYKRLRCRNVRAALILLHSVGLGLPTEVIGTEENFVYRSVSQCITFGITEACNRV